MKTNRRMAKDESRTRSRINTGYAHQEKQMKLTAAEHFQNAQRRSRQGDDPGTLADLNRTIKADTGFAIAYFARGEMRRSLGDPKKAIADYNVAIQLQPDLTLAYMGRGNARRNLGDRAGSFDDFTNAAQLEPENPAAHVGLGFARPEDDAKSQVADFNRAIQLDPKYAEAYFGRALAQMGTKASVADFTKALKLNPKHGIALLYRGDAYSAQGSDDKAVADYTRALELGVAASTQIYTKRAASLLKTGNVRAALADCNTALQNTPKPGPAYLIRGTANFALGKINEAIADLKRAIKLEPALEGAAIQVLDAAQRYQQAKNNRQSTKRNP